MSTSRSRLSRIALVLATSTAILPLIGNADGAPLGAEFRVNTNQAEFQGFPAVASTPGGRFIAAWQGVQSGSFQIYGQRYDEAGKPSGAEFLVSTTADNDGRYPQIASTPTGESFIVWNGFNPEHNHLEIFGRRFAADGTPAGPEFQVNAPSTVSHQFPDVAMQANGVALVVWKSFATPDDAILGQRYSATGAKLGGEFQINSNPNIIADAVKVAMAPDGRSVVVWQDFGADGDRFSIMARRYSPSGGPLGNAFLVNQYTVSDQTAPDVAMAANGDFVLTWESSGQDGSSKGIYARRYSADGVAQGGEFPVNVVSFDEQDNPSIAMSADGAFTIAWESDSQILAQRYSAGGVPLAGNFVVNTSGVSTKDLPAVSMDADGDTAFVWHSNQRGGDFNIYARRYRGDQRIDVALNMADRIDPAPAGSQNSYTYSVSNLTSPATLTGVPAIDQTLGQASGLVVDATPPKGSSNASFTGSNWACTPSGKKSRCEYALPLRAGQNASPLTLTVNMPNAPGTVAKASGNATAEQFDPLTKNNKDSEKTQIPIP